MTSKHKTPPTSDVALTCQSPRAPAATETSGEAAAQSVAAAGDGAAAALDDTPAPVPTSAPAPASAPESGGSVQEPASAPPAKRAKRPRPKGPSRRERGPRDSQGTDASPGETLVVVKLKTSRYTDTDQRPIKRGRYVRTTARRAAGLVGKKKAIHIDDAKLAGMDLDIQDLPIIG